MKAIRKDVIVQIVEQERTTESGLIIQGHDTNHQQRLTVITCGEQVTEVRAGDVVIVDQNARGRGFELQGQRYFVIRETEIVAVYQ
jgi:co-chaperonin GroES (HSP10)